MRVSTIGFTRYVLTVVLLVAVPSGPNALSAQQSIAASARMSWPATSTARQDSTTAVLVLEITGLLPVARRGMKLQQVQLTDVTGHTYTPLAVITSNSPRTLLEQYTNTATGTEEASTPKYVFYVRPGDTHFELRLPSLDPIPVNASVIGAPGRKG